MECTTGVNLDISCWGNLCNSYLYPYVEFVLSTFMNQYWPFNLCFIGEFTDVADKML